MSITGSRGGGSQREQPVPEPTVINIALSRAQFLTLAGLVAAAFVTLFGIIYWGVKDDIKDVKTGNQFV